MNSEEFVDAVIANLKIIGMLQKNDKICVRKGQISIDRGDGKIQSFRRWFNRDSRDVTIIHLRNTVNNAIRIARTFVGNASAGGNQHVHHWTLAKLVEEMQAAEIGLQNLRATYIQDSSVVAAVDVVSDRLRAYGEELTSKLGLPRPKLEPPIEAKLEQTDDGDDSVHEKKSQRSSEPGSASPEAEVGEGRRDKARSLSKLSNHAFSHCQKSIA